MLKIIEKQFNEQFDDDFKKLFGFIKFKNKILNLCKEYLDKNKDEKSLILFFVDLLKENISELYSDNLKNEKIIIAIKRQNDDCFNLLKKFLIKEERYEDVNYIIKIRSGSNF